MSGASGVPCHVPGGYHFYVFRSLVRATRPHSSEHADPTRSPSPHAFLDIVCHDASYLLRSLIRLVAR